METSNPKEDYKEYTKARLPMLYEEMDDFIKLLIDRDKIFSVVQWGSTGYIFVHNDKIRYTFTGSEDRKFLKGAHIVKMVERDVINYLENNPQPEFEIGVSLYQFNVKNLFYALRIDGDIVQEDINHCYWQVAYKFGYITQKTYEKGLPYKMARNVALGSLIKCTYVTDYINGKPKNKKILRTSEGYQSIYWSIIGYVNKLKEELMNNNNYSILWLTDCIIYNYNDVDIQNNRGHNEVEMMFKKYGFKTKKNQIKHISVDDKTWNYEVSGEPKVARISMLNRYFAQSQLKKLNKSKI